MDQRGDELDSWLRVPPLEVRFFNLHLNIPEFDMKTFI